jgi:hypothetical protein
LRKAGALSATIARPSSSSTIRNPAAAVRFVDLAATAGLGIVELEEWRAIVADRAPAFVKLAALVCRSQADPTTGADELRFEHNRTYDDARLRAALASSFRVSRPLGADAIARFAAGIKKS